MPYPLKVERQLAKLMAYLGMTQPESHDLRGSDYSLFDIGP